jgi:hypothetical protein
MQFAQLCACQETISSGRRRGIVSDGPEEG